MERTITLPGGGTVTLSAPTLRALSELEATARRVNEGERRAGVKYATFPATVGVVDPRTPTSRTSPAGLSTSTSRADRADDPWFHQRPGESLASYATRLARWMPDAWELAKQLGYSVGPLSSMYNDGRTRGACHNPTRTIGLDVYLDEWEAKETLAHEVAHALGVGDGEDEAIKERACDAFAGHFEAARGRVLSGELRRWED